MQRVLELMGVAIADTWAAVAPVLAVVPVWIWATVATVVLLLAAFALLRPQNGTRGEARNRPEVMLSRAEMVPDPTSDGLYALVAAFSNLHHGPVQLLRIAATGADGATDVVETTALVMARRAVELEADLDLGGTGNARLELYVYVPSSSARAWRLRVPMAWEPSTRRYKAEPLKQRLEPVHDLPEPPVRAADVPRQPEPDAGYERPRPRRPFPDEF